MRHGLCGAQRWVKSDLSHFGVLVAHNSQNRRKSVLEYIDVNSIKMHTYVRVNHPQTPIGSIDIVRCRYGTPLVRSTFTLQDLYQNESDEAQTWQADRTRCAASSEGSFKVISWILRIMGN